VTRIVLFGAGASFGSGKLGTVPPLGKDLFEELVARGGVAAGLPDDLQEEFRKNFELGMGRFHEIYTGGIVSFQRELAQYLAEFVPTPDSTYIKLFRLVNLNRPIFCTLNYDLLIELAAAQAGFPGTSYTSVPTPGRLRLLKPHGSCNFWPDIPSTVIMNECSFGDNIVDVEWGVRPLPQDETLRRCATQNSLAPAIAVYAEGKKVRICPTYVERQQELWAQAAREATKVCIVGARVHTPDAHIWQPLASSPADVYYFGFDEQDEEEFGVWQDQSRKRNMYYTKADFSEAVPMIARRLERT
jgi:hypothetical protein